MNVLLLTFYLNKMLQYRKKGKKQKKNQIIVLKIENKEEHSQINFQIQIMDIYKIKTISAADIS